MAAEIQSYPPPTELPAMRSGEIDGRYLDCTPALAPVGDRFSAIPSVEITRIDTTPMNTDGTDLILAGSAWINDMDETGRIPTYGFHAGTSIATYLIRVTSSTTQGRLFIRDWKMSVLPAEG